MWRLGAPEISQSTGNPNLGQLRKCREAGSLRMGDPGLEPGTPSLGEAACRLQSCQLAHNPCKHAQHRARKTTGDDWALQPDGPIVAPRRHEENWQSYPPVAVITPTTRSSPDAPEAGRCKAAGSRRPPPASVRGGFVRHVAVGVQRAAAHCVRARARHSPQRLPCRPDGIACLPTSSSAGLASNRQR